jgi:uncharacterized phage protein (TIGR01671 family)
VDNGGWIRGNLWNPCWYNAGEYCIHDGSCAIQVDPETVGQFTGLTDKNGKKIYEGDLALYEGDEVPYEVLFVRGAWEINGFNHSDYLYDTHDDVKVVGNIYNNSERPKGGNK